MASVMTSKGNKAAFLILLIIVVFAVLLVGGFSLSTTSPSSQNGNTYTPDQDAKTGNTQNTLQLKTIKFITTTQSCTANLSSGSTEPGVLWAMIPPPGGTIIPGGTIKVFYTDEWPLTLGVGNVTKMSKNSTDHIVQPNINFGDESKRDPRTPKGSYPYFPAIFRTDITNDPSSQDGDAENGGKAYKPYEVYGSWQALGQQTHPDNHTNLDSSPDSFPMTSNMVKSGGAVQGDTAEIIWRADDLELTAGHAYRAEIIIHDGDRDGDVGLGCATIQY